MKKKDSKNYLDFIPKKNPEIEYETGEDGIITSLSNGKDFITSWLSASSVVPV